MLGFMSDRDVVARALGHIKNKTTDTANEIWREPVSHYTNAARFEEELAVLKSTPTPFCPSIALRNPGDYIARDAAQTPIIVVRGRDKKVRAFINACRHRGAELVAGKGCGL